VEVFEDHEDRLTLGLPQEEPLERLQCALSTLGWVERPPAGLLDRYIQER
jgi:hypothetical protein